MPISAESQLVKNRKIAQTRQATVQRRWLQAVKTYQLKIVSNKLSVKQKSALDQVFVQVLGLPLRGSLALSMRLLRQSEPLCKN